VSEAPREHVHGLLLPLLARKEELERELGRIEREIKAIEERPGELVGEQESFRHGF